MVTNNINTRANKDRLKNLFETIKSSTVRNDIEQQRDSSTIKAGLHILELLDDNYINPKIKAALEIAMKEIKIEIEIEIEIELS